MSLKTRLDPLTMEMAVLGGAVLGHGGGGKLEHGLYLGELATAQGNAHLVEPGSLPDQAVLAVVGTAHTSGIDTFQITPRQAHHALEMLQNEFDIPIAGLVNAGLGSVDSIIGWELSGFLNIPLLDAGLPAEYQPIPLRNLLTFWQETAASENFTISLTGRTSRNNGHSHYLWQGNPTELQEKLDNLPAGESESCVFAAGPLTLDSLKSHSSTTIINRTLQVGQAIVATSEAGGEATVATLQRVLPSKSAVFATVTQINWQGQGQDAAGIIELRDVNNRHLTLTYSQRYLQLLENGTHKATFPELIITLGILGTPLSGEEVFIGQDLYLLIASSS